MVTVIRGLPGSHAPKNPPHGTPLTSADPAITRDIQRRANDAKMVAAPISMTMKQGDVLTAAIADIMERDKVAEPRPLSGVASSYADIVKENTYRVVAEGLSSDLIETLENVLGDMMRGLTPSSLEVSSMFSVKLPEDALTRIDGWRVSREDHTIVVTAQTRETGKREAPELTDAPVQPWTATETVPESTSATLAPQGEGGKPEPDTKRSESEKQQPVPQDVDTEKPEPKPELEPESEPEPVTPATSVTKREAITRVVTEHILYVHKDTGETVEEETREHTFTSTDGGATWTPRWVDLPELTVSPDERFIVAYPVDDERITGESHNIERRVVVAPRFVDEAPRTMRAQVFGRIMVGDKLFVTEFEGVDVQAQVFKDVLTGTNHDTAVDTLISKARAQAKTELDDTVTVGRGSVNGNVVTLELALKEKVLNPATGSEYLKPVFRDLAVPFSAPKNVADWSESLMSTLVAVSNEVTRYVAFETKLKPQEIPVSAGLALYMFCDHALRKQGNDHSTLRGQAQKQWGHTIDRYFMLPHKQRFFDVEPTARDIAQTSIQQVVKLTARKTQSVAVIVYPTAVQSAGNSKVAVTFSSHYLIGMEH